MGLLIVTLGYYIIISCSQDLLKMAETLHHASELSGAFAILLNWCCKFQVGEKDDGNSAVIETYNCLKSYSFVCEDAMKRHNHLCQCRFCK